LDGMSTAALLRAVCTMAAMLSTAAWSTPPTCSLTGGRHARRSLPPSMTAPEPDMDMLFRRIQDVKCGIAPCRLVVLESMVLGQKLFMTAPPELVQLLESGDRASPIVVLGRDGERPHSHGVSVRLESVTPVPVSPVHPEGTADIVLSAQRLVEIVEVLPDKGSLWLGRPARARWIDHLDDIETAPEPSLIERSKELEKKVEKWIGLVRRTGNGDTPDQLESILANLGTMPAAEQPSARAMWVAGLINPMTMQWRALGVARDIRGAALMAPNAHVRLKTVEVAMAQSIKSLVNRN